MSIATILVVEDDPLQQDMLEIMLARHAYTVLRATTGEAALDIISGHPEIDLILLDVLLPGRMDGIALCQLIRADQSRLYVPIVMVTALGTTEQLERGLEAGADDYITKPFGPRELMARVQAGLRIRRIQRDLAEAQSRYRVLVETSRDLIFALDTDQRLTYISPTSEVVTGYPPEALLADSLPFSCIVHPDDAQRLNEWRANLRDNLEGADLEFRMVRADDEQRWAALSWSTIYDRVGNSAGVQGTIRDITHRKAVEAATWRRSQELAALNLIAARLNQSLEAANTLDEALNALLEVVGAEFGAIHILDQWRWIVRVAHGLPEAAARRLLGVDTDPRAWQILDLSITREHADEQRGRLTPDLKALGIQAALTIPLRERGALSGALTLASRSYDKFESTEITLISTVAEQISAALANERLYTEARRRADELGVMYEIGRMLTSTLDLDKVLRVIMEAAVNLLEVEAGSVLLLDENTGELEFVAAVGAGSDQLPRTRLPAGSGVAGLALREGRSLLIDDTQQSRAFYPAVDQMTGLVTQRLIATPLRVKDRLIGVMEVINKRADRFTAADVRLMDLLAPTAAAAIDNARLYARETQLTEEVRRHNRELSALHAISAALSQSLEIQDVMDAALLVLQPQFEYADAYITVRDDEQITHTGTHHVLASTTALNQLPLAEQLLQQAIASRAVKLLPDASAHVTTQESIAWRAAHIGAVAAVPLWGHATMQGGLVMAWATSHHFDATVTQLLAAIGQQIGVAIERASLYEVARRRAHEIERSYAQLVQSEKLAATGRLAISLAHEINNPLQAIQNCLHLVLEFQLDETRKTNYLNMAREEVERLSILVQSMLDFYRPSRSEQPVANVTAVLERVLALSEQKLRDNQIKTTEEFEAGPLLVQTAPDQLGQVFLNMIMNAADAMENGGALRIIAQPVDQMVEIRINDTGPGIPQDILAHIFEPFYSTKDEGTGLGLAISYTIIERHGGTLQVESEVGKGTEFIIRLPRATPELEAAGQEAGNSS